MPNFKRSRHGVVMLRHWKKLVGSDGRSCDFEFDEDCRPCGSYRFGHGVFQAIIAKVSR